MGGEPAVRSGDHIDRAADTSALHRRHNRESGPLETGERVLKVLHGAPQVGVATARRGHGRGISV